MQISDEAVDAAVDALVASRLGDHKGINGEEFVEAARAALEAAAPHMLAPLVADLDKWAGRSRTGFYDEAQDDVVQILNPYRSQA